MDQCIFPAFRIENVSYNLTAEKLAEILKSVFQGEENFNLRSEQIKFFQEGRHRTAVINGVRVPMSDIKRLLSMMIIGGREIIVSHDYAWPRNELGRFITPLSGGNKQLMEKLFMLPPWNIHSFFVPDLAREIEDGNYCNKVTMNGLTAGVDLNMLHRPGRVLALKYNAAENNLVVEYFTLLEKLQALCLLNENREVASIGSFKDCIINRQIGLGRNGLLLDVTGLDSAHGYIPFEDFNQDLIKRPNPNQSGRQINTDCYKCDEKGSLQLVGVTSCLKFYAAKCTRCRYSNKLNVLAQEVGVHFKSELFSRVIIERNDLNQFDGRMTAYNIVHTPIQFVYSNSKEAQDVICPILEHESWLSGKIFTLTNRINGTLVDQGKFLENVKSDVLFEAEEKEEALYLIKIRVPKTKVWTPDSIQQISSITLHVQWRLKWNLNDAYERDFKRVKLLAMEHDGEEFVILFCRIKMTTRCFFRPNQVMELFPYSPTFEYEALKSTMSMWISRPRTKRFQMLDNLLLGGQVNYTLEPNLVPADPLNIRHLNPEQQEAVLRCQRGRLTVVQGPPGTGKTHTAAVTVLEIARTEPGLIICTAKSNEAANNLCEALEKKLAAQRNSTLRQDKLFYNGINVVRMASFKKQWNFFRRLPAIDDLDNKFRFLHEHIAADSDFFNDPNLLDLFDQIHEKGMEDLTLSEIGRLEYHIEEIGRKVLRNSQILVTTIASLMDGRLDKYLGDKLDNADPGSKDPIINTIMIDEAGVVPMPVALSVLAFPAKRFLLFGDQQQLPPLVNCYSSELAGLSMSVMQFLELGAARNHPDIWKTLCVQYRMNSAICRVISGMTYGGQLACGPNIRDRLADPAVRAFRRRVHAAVPDSRKSDIVIFQHELPEDVNDARSKFNEGEAAMVVRLVQQLVNAGVGQHQITVITLYDAQRTLLLGELMNSPMTNMITVVNVDSFQGKENDIVILSFVRSNPNGNIGFCKSQNRLTVAISRARQFEFFVGNLAMITANQGNDYHVGRLRNGLVGIPRVFNY